MKKLSSFYLSEILHKDIYDEYGDCIGKLCDIYVTTGNGYPKAIGYKVKKGGDINNYEFRSIDFYNDDSKIVIKVRGVKDIIPRAYSYLLSKNLLDKQIVDINGKKVVRVNDLRIACISTEIRVIAVETGMLALSRRYGLDRIVKFLYKLFRKEVYDTVIMWDDVESLEMVDDNLKIAVPYKKISELHPADIADILEEVDLKYRNKIFESLDEHLAADTLEEIDPEIQVDILETMNQSKVSGILNNMSNDEIADILEELDEEMVEKLLMNLETEDEEKVRDLMKYEEESVGSIMNTDFVSFNLNITAAETLELLKEIQPEDKVSHYIYITDQNEKLQGVVSLTELVFCKGDMKLREIMKKEIIKLSDDERLDTAIKKFVKYDLIAIPVIDSEERLQGVVIINDIIEEVFEEKWKKKLKRAV
ncbi:magnesium transporter [Clostridium thermopalmarium]|uniref:Magnesium transporter MgtE n=1 Tax=Clostridium thermopalmarium DSM 5974 TaxID=1121340 RepID=A0A2T0AV17_9CLOT|nr:CBS domain-containing protein [Clostridium thermopalmarium]MBE6043802.1 CBS domain-containing protein [Clostridium thermopalmarium]PRR74415.1 Magnesium transporter MgtE [Clostridium thermopalmarium DSM 5974]PVZ21638.1 PRC-barrel domain protein [Clostridium thermopalmarium DSM 5974]